MQIKVPFEAFFPLLKPLFASSVQLAWRGDIVLKDVCSLLTLQTRARNLRNLFSKLLILQNNQPPPCKPVPEPLLNNVGIVHLEKKTGVGCCIYQFSLSLFAHYLFVMALRRPILGPAGCPVRMASPKISSSQRWPFCSFSTADVCGSKKTAMSHLLFVFVASLLSCFFFFLEGIHWRKVVTSLTNYYSTYKMHLNQERQEVTHGIFYIYEPKKMQIEKSSQNQTVTVHNITDVTALSCT